MNNLLRLMHDTANQSALIGITIVMMMKDIQNDKLNKELILENLNKIKQYNMKNNSILDKFYEENKELYAKKSV